MRVLSRWFCCKSRVKLFLIVCRHSFQMTGIFGKPWKCLFPWIFRLMIKHVESCPDCEPIFDRGNRTIGAWVIWAHDIVHRLWLFATEEFRQFFLISVIQCLKWMLLEWYGREYVLVKWRLQRRSWSGAGEVWVPYELQ